ncbi:MAG: hypothetical protein WC003_15370 [Terrimicrobiaceae bacterium]
MSRPIPPSSIAQVEGSGMALIWKPFTPTGPNCKSAATEIDWVAPVRLVNSM